MPIDCPITWYWLVGLVGGLPVTEIPKSPWRLPDTGIVRFSCWPDTRSP